MAVTAMIQRLGWRSLEDRRRDARLTMLYKIDHELVAISRTDVLYACSLIDIDEIFRFLRRKLRVLFALFVMESMCWLQFTLSVMVTPRYLADVTAASNFPRMEYSCLFIFYINDLQDRLRSTVRLFADDTIAYLTITSEDDAEHLQEDLDKLAQWGEDSRCISITEPSG
jgi:hypothetical protein